MYTMDNLNAEETAKIQPVLQGEIPRILAHANLSARKMDAQDMIDIDTWMQVGDHPAHYYWIRDVSFPQDWTGADFIDFIVKLAKGPWVKRVGILQEFPFTEIPMSLSFLFFSTAEEIYTPSEMVRLASQGAGPGVPPNRTLTVHVTDQQSNPIVGARVEVGGNVQQTDSMGDAAFTIPGGGYTLTVSQSGYQSTSMPVTLDMTKTVRVALVKTVPAPVHGGNTSGGGGNTNIQPTGGFMDRLAASLHISKTTAELVLFGGGALLLTLLLRRRKEVSNYGD